MPIDPVDLARRFIAIPSPSGEEGEFGRVLVPILEGIGLAVTVQPVGADRFNLLAGAGGVPRVVLCTHIDVVPPHIPPSMDGQWLYGRGACDTKGILAAMLAAVEKILAAGHRDFALLLVVGEEVDGAGAKVAAEHLEWPVEFIVVGEPTGLRFARGQKGALKADLVVHGKSAHSAYPERGDSALLKMMPVLQDLQAADWGQHPVLGAGTFNTGELHAGVRANVIPGEARAAVMVRVVDSVEATEARLRQVVAGRAEITMGTANEPQEIHVPAGEEGIVVAFNTDIPWLRRLGRPLLYGPGSILDAHGSGERIAIKDLLAAVDVYAALVPRLLQGGAA